jgi:hypothetical protein
MSQSRNSLYFGLFLVIFVAIIVAIILGHGQKKPFEDINTFTDCVKAGYPVMKSYPEQCTLPNGKFFVSQVLPER